MYNKAERQENGYYNYFRFMFCWPT